MVVLVLSDSVPVRTVHWYYLLTWHDTHVQTNTRAFAADHRDSWTECVPRPRPACVSAGQPARAVDARERGCRRGASSGLAVAVELSRQRGRTDPARHVAVHGKPALNARALALPRALLAQRAVAATHRPPVRLGGNCVCLTYLWLGKCSRRSRRPWLRRHLCPPSHRQRPGCTSDPSLWMYDTDLFSMC